MTEEKSKEALFELHQEYMTHTPEERTKLYEDYQKRRNEIKSELLEFIKSKRVSRTI